MKSLVVAAPTGRGKMSRLQSMNIAPVSFAQLIEILQTTEVFSRDEQGRSTFLGNEAAQKLRKRFADLIIPMHYLIMSIQNQLPGLFDRSELTVELDEDLHIKLSLIMCIRAEYFGLASNNFEQISTFLRPCLQDDCLFTWNPKKDGKKIKIRHLLKIRLQQFAQESLSLVTVAEDRVSRAEKDGAIEDQLEKLEYLVASIVDLCWQLLHRNADIEIQNVCEAVNKQIDFLPALRGFEVYLTCLLKNKKLLDKEPPVISRKTLNKLYSKLQDSDQKKFIETARSYFKSCDLSMNEYLEELKKSVDFTWHNYVMYVSLPELSHSARGYVWEIAVALFLLKHGREDNDLGILRAINKHYAKPGSVFSREFDMHTTKIKCECKYVDWVNLPEERKNEIKLQLDKQIEITSYPNGVIPFYLISREPLSQEFIDYLSGKRITIIDPHSKGPFEVLYSYKID